MDATGFDSYTTLMCREISIEIQNFFNSQGLEFFQVLLSVGESSEVLQVTRKGRVKETGVGTNVVMRGACMWRLVQDVERNRECPSRLNSQNQPRLSLFVVRLDIITQNKSDCTWLYIFFF